MVIRLDLPIDDGRQESQGRFRMGLANQLSGCGVGFKRTILDYE